MSTGALIIHDANEKVYDGLIGSVQSQVTQGQNANYQSPDAKSEFSQGISCYNQATTLANQGQWSTAVTDLNQATTYFNQATASEQNYQAAQAASPSSSSAASSSSSVAAAAQAQSNTNLAIGVGVVIVLALIGGVIMMRRRNGTKTPSST